MALSHESQRSKDSRKRSVYPKKHNIDVNELITDKHSGSTMLHLAYRKDHQKCIELLRKAGADPGKKDTRDLKAYQRDHWIEGSREGCEGQAAHEQQHIPPVPAESGVQSDESQQENSSDEEAAQEEMSLSVLNPKHQLVCAGSYSSQVCTIFVKTKYIKHFCNYYFLILQPDHKDPPRDSSYVHSAEELLPSILPFSAYAVSGECIQY